MKGIGTIELEGMEFHAYHGCLASEKAIGNTFLVDFKGEYDMGKAALGDNLEDALDYSRIYDIVSREMAQPSDLLEHVAGRIVRAIEAEIPELCDFSVRVSKKRPPVDGVCAWSRITMYK
ncbi:MAG: dihydroneopterin aldolase [Bacteroidales bacterium]|nr:dihydroneopterin aldolase [Candidatus Cryptobacteroides caccocaballi]